MPKGLDNELPDFIENNKYKIQSMRLTENFTKAPTYLTESTLISYMEEHGIGTDASIPSHIKNIIDRGYVTVEAKRTLVPTALGLALARGICEIDPELILPTVWSNIEKSVDSIAKGEVV